MPVIGAVALSLFTFHFSLSLVPASAQHAGHVIPTVPQALLERPLTLRTGIGTVHDDVTTASADARAFYDQGLAYLHSYVWIEAARSFHQALRADAGLALAHVGLSIAYIELNKPAEAQKAVAAARGLAPKVSDHERRHIEMRAAQLDAELAPGDANRLAAYRKAADAGLAAFPKDAEFHLQRGLAESPDPADRGQGTNLSSVPHFEKALALAPNHPGAHHYLTHALENGGNLKEALAHGQAFAKLAPNVPHARHMYGHDLRRVGRIDEAIVEFEAADRLARAYFKQENVPPQLDWHYHHNLDLLGTSYQYRGEVKKAGATLKQSFDLPTNLVGQAVNKREWPLFLLSRGRVDESLAAAKTLISHPHPTVQATGHIEAGYALLASNQYGAAGEASNAALKLLRAGAEGGQLAAAALQGLQGEFYLRTAARDRGRQTLLQAAARWRALPGPDNWAQALFRLDAMARAARAVGDWELAGQIAKQMIEHDPAYAGSHYAVALVAQHDEDAATAKAEFALALKYWSHADPDLPELVEARKRAR